MKHVKALMAAGAVVCLLAGCGGDSEPAESGSQAPSVTEEQPAETVPPEVFEDQTGRKEAFAAVETVFGSDSFPEERCAAMTDAYRDTYVDERKVIEGADPAQDESGSIGLPEDEGLTCEEAAEPAEVQSIGEYEGGGQIEFEDNGGSFLFYMSRAGVGCELVVKRQEDGTWLLDEPGAVDIDGCASR